MWAGSEEGLGMRLADDSLRRNLLYCRSYYGIQGTWGLWRLGPTVGPGMVQGLYGVPGYSDMGLCLTVYWDTLTWGLWETGLTVYAGDGPRTVRVTMVYWDTLT
jgi:hypothetical protein